MPARAPTRVALINDGTGQFELETFVLPIYIGETSTTFIDADVDGLPDLLVNSSGVEGEELHLYRHAGPEFVKAWAGPIPGCYGSALARIDYDQDALDDVRVTSSCNQPPPLLPATLFLGTGQADFLDSGIEALVGSDPIAIVVSDFNGDGRDDFATPNQYGDDISVMLRADAGFADDLRVGEICAGCTRPSRLMAGDFDGTGVADELIVIMETESPTFPLYLILHPIDGPPLHAVELDPHGSRLLAIADWNGDGVADIATADQDLALVLLLSNP